MPDQPTLQTPRLILRPFRLEDAPMVQRLAGAPEIADTTMHIPHPYLDGVAEAWIAKHPTEWADGRLATFAITERADGALAGAMGLTIAAAYENAELGYWVGVPYWGRGYCTEAARAVLEFAFDQLKLHRVQARHYTRNPASGRVMQKLGMKSEGVHRESMLTGDRFEDVAFCALLASER